MSSAPVSTGSVVWRSRGQLYVTAVVKASFGLVNDQPMELLEPSDLVRAELYHRDNPSRSVRATSDMAPYLHRADVTLLGHAYAPSGEPATMVTVRLAVFRDRPLLDKSAHVYGDRSEGAPKPFDKIPLMYEKALGGVGWDENPMGIGMRAGGAPDPTAPNIVHPTDPTKLVGFGPISRTWPARRRLLGKTDRKALDKPVAELPDGFDWAYFQAAPGDQQIEFLQGDEWIVLEGIHPGFAKISSRLPNARVVGTVRGLSGGDAVRGLVFHADVLRIDADQQSCSVVWRSSMPVRNEAAIEALEIAVALQIGGQSIEWSESIAEDDSPETIELDESALLEEPSLSEDDSDFAKTIQREDKADTVTTTAARPGKIAEAPRPEKTSLWTPEMAAAVRAGAPSIDEPSTDAETQKLRAKAERASLTTEGTLKLKPLRNVGEKLSEEGTQKLSPIALPRPRAPLATVPLIDLPDATKRSSGNRFDGTFALSMDDQSEAAERSAVPFAAQPKAPPLAPKAPPLGRPPSKFEGTMALSPEAAREASKKPETPFGEAKPPRPDAPAPRAIPGAPWSPKSPKAPPPPRLKTRLDQTVTAIHDMPTGGDARDKTGANVPVTPPPAPPAMVTPSAPAPPSSGQNTPPGPASKEPEYGSVDSGPPAPPARDLSPFKPPGEPLTPLPPPVPPPARPKLPPLKPTLPKGAPAPKVTASREAATLKALETTTRRAQDAVPVVTNTGFTVASFPWQLKAATDALVVVVKVTCDLVADGPAVVRPVSDRVSGDLHEGGDASRTVLYPTDFAVFKPRADVLLVGHAYAPGGSSPASQALFRFGSRKNGFERRLAVFGERRWQKAGIKLVPEAPRPFKKVPLVWERAFGGPSFEKNPTGIGAAGDLVPQLETAGSLVTSPTDTPDPACFAGIPARWPSRRALLGTYDAAWKKSRWPYFPDDFDWSYFQVAPRAQELPHLTGDEPFELGGVHAEHPLIRGKLPGIRPRCFAQRTGDSGEMLEVLLRLDTVTFEPDAMKVTLVWRGAIETISEHADDVAELFVIDEPVAGPAIERAAAISMYRAEKLVRSEEAPTDVTGVAPPPANESEPGAAADPPEIQPLTAEEAAAIRAEVVACLADKRALDGRDLAGADLSGLDFSGISLRGATLSRADLSRCKLVGATLSNAQLEDAILSGADLTRADLTSADLTRADLTQATLTGARIAGAVLAQARAEGARFDEARGDGASFVAANLHKARFDRAALGGADFTRATLEYATFDHADLPEVRLYDAVANGASFNDAKLDGARADGVSLKRSSLQRVQARSSIWDKAILDEASFLGASLVDAGFARASCRATVFSGADLTSSRLRRGSFRGASFLKSNLMTATLEGADMEGADLRGANLHGAETHRARLSGAKLDLAIVTATKLAEGAGQS